MFVQEELFHTYLHAPLKSMAQMTVLQLKFSKLSEVSRSESSLAAVLNSFNEALHPYGKAFGFRNDDVFVVYAPKINEKEIDALLIKTWMYFSSDPKANKTQDLKRTFSLPEDKDALMYETSRIETLPNYRSREDGGSLMQVRRKFILPLAVEKDKTKLTPEVLARVSKALSKTDFSNMIRRQYVCIILDGIAPQPMFEEVFVSIADLGETILPDVSLTATPWLFQDLTETLDKRVLCAISRHEDGAFNRDFSLNLNVSTILSDEFREFDEGVRQSMKTSVVLELQPIDIFSDFAMYLKARDYALKLGYKICVDSVSVEALPYVNRDKLGADFIKLTWQPDLPSILTDEPDLKEKIASLGTNRTILCRVDDENALNFAKESQINLLQGRYIQHLLSGTSRRFR